MKAEPGMNPLRLVALMKEIVRACCLNLKGRVVLTEAASGPYVVTPILAALAGASRVLAITKDTAYGKAADVRETTQALAGLAGVGGVIEIGEGRPKEWFAVADIVTNSGHVRPLDSTTVGWMKPGAVIPLMYEAWELRPSDVDVAACERRGIRVCGTKESHPDFDVIEFTGAVGSRILLEAGIEIVHCRLVVLGDNPLARSMAAFFARMGATVERVDSLPKAKLGNWDALVVAEKPEARIVVGEAEAAWLKRNAPGAVVAQFLGDLDRAALDAHGVSYWPKEAPRPGHQGLLPSAIGPAPVVRLQAAGLKVGELLLRWPGLSVEEKAYLDPLG